MAAVRICIGSDHAGFDLKELLRVHLVGGGHDVIDVGTDSVAPVDYPPICAEVAQQVVEGRADVGMVLGGSGQGEQIAANKVNGIRAALCNDIHTATLSRSHNDANVLSMGARIVASALAMEIADVWLATPFDGGRHEARVNLIHAIESDQLKGS